MNDYSFYFLLFARACQRYDLLVKVLLTVQLFDGPVVLEFADFNRAV